MEEELLKEVYKVRRHPHGVRGEEKKEMEEEEEAGRGRVRGSWEEVGTLIIGGDEAKVGHDLLDALQELSLRLLA